MGCLSKFSLKLDFSGYPQLHKQATLEMAPADEFSSSELVNWFLPIIDGLREILTHHRCAKEIRDSICKQIESYISNTHSFRDAVLRMKYVLTFPMAKYLRNELPQGEPLNFKGSARKWVRNRLNAYKNKNMHLWYSWLNCKRCSNPLPDDWIPSLMKDHKDALCKEDCGDPFWIDQIMKNPLFVRLLKYVRRKLEKEVVQLRGKDSCPRAFSSNLIKFSPSTSASFERTRCEGGSRREVNERLGISSWDFPQKELDSMDYYVRTINRDGKMTTNQVISLYDYNFDSELSELEDLVFDEIVRNPLPPADIKIVFEPLKARIISKGPSLPYYYCKPIQKAFWGILKEIPCFRLLGRSADPMDIWDLSSRPGDWFSVDYKAATDNLSYKYSRCIVDEILSSDTDLLCLFDYVLGPHYLKYATGMTGSCPRLTDAVGIQNTGQLMGSILSFPILCLANIGIYLLNCHLSSGKEEYSDREYDRILSEVLVNGDDMLYKCSPEERDWHDRISKNVGLSLSPGKVYYHSRYSNINSTCYDMGTTPKEINYYNVALLYNKHKVQSKNKDSTFHPAHAEERNRYKNECVGNIPILMKGLYYRSDEIRVLAKCLSLNKKTIVKDSKAVIVLGGKDQWFDRNLFLPESLGGMGLLPPLGWKFAITPAQQRVASFSILKREFDTQFPTRMPVIKEIQAPSSKFLEVFEKEKDEPIRYRQSDYRIKKSRIRAINNVHYYGCSSIVFV
jgi:hypothetical protein